MTSAPEVSLATGHIRGVSDDGIHRFLGIPYAAPPFGDRRFRLPEPPAAWDGVREADNFGPSSPQVPYRPPLDALLPSLDADGSEPDILTANVWTPATAPATKLPVVVWIHGGGFERGGSSIAGYDGTAFARHGIVYVSLNYRLGAEGFSVFPDAPRNLGLEDVAAALRWVHTEIAAFGGDPSRITVMGESAGGALAAAAMARPDTRPLIAGAIIQSGPLDAAEPARAGRVTRALAKDLGIEPTRDAFAAVSPSALLAARARQSAGSSPLRGAPGFVLALDPASLPAAPKDALVKANAPILIGTNTDEYRLWFPPEALAKITSWQARLAFLALRIPRAAQRAYRQAFPGSSVGERVGQALTDKMLRAPMASLAIRRPAPTYVYEFAWPSPVRDLRAAHALELGFTFDGLDKPDSLALTGPDAPQAIADDMHAAWVRMIVDGDPGWEPWGDSARIRLYATQPRTVAVPRRAALDALMGPV